MSENQIVNPIDGSRKKSKRTKVIGICAAVFVGIILLTGYFGRASILPMISGLYPYGDYRALLAQCSGSGIDIYWAPIHVDDGSLDSLEDGAKITYDNVIYSVASDPFHIKKAYFARSLNKVESEDILGCGE